MPSPNCRHHYHSIAIFVAYISTITATTTSLPHLPPLLPSFHASPLASIWFFPPPSSIQHHSSWATVTSTMHPLLWSCRHCLYHIYPSTTQLLPPSFHYRCCTTTTQLLPFSAATTTITAATTTIPLPTHIAAVAVIPLVMATTISATVAFVC